MNNPFGHDVHFYNLSRGVLCPHWGFTVGRPLFVRIQSTHCEQKLWDDVLLSVGPHFLHTAAQSAIMVHDCSEVDRETRAMWQGLSWIRYCLNRAWFNSEGPASIAFRGQNITRYWRQQYTTLPKSTRRMLSYYKKYVVPGRTEAQLRSCWQL